MDEQMKAFLKRLDQQNAEFEALEHLAKQYQNITVTAVVDDDYPAVRHGYESALRNFLTACKANGRQL